MKRCHSLLKLESLIELTVSQTINKMCQMSFKNRSGRSWNESLRGVDEWIGTDFTLSASIARAKWCNGKNVDHLSWPVFGALPGEVIRRDHIINQGYSHVSDLVKQHVFNLRGAGAPIPLYIPPIPAIILQRCGNRADRFFYETLALREEFAIARRKLWAYQKLIVTRTDKLSVNYLKSIAMQYRM